MLKINDHVEVVGADSDEEYYKVGDTGKIIECEVRSLPRIYLVRFGPDRWWVPGIDLKVIE